MRKRTFDHHFQDRYRWRDYIKRNCRKVGNESLHSIRVSVSGEPFSVFKLLVGLLFKLILISSSLCPLQICSSKVFSQTFYYQHSDCLLQYSNLKTVKLQVFIHQVFIVDFLLVILLK